MSANSFMDPIFSSLRENRMVLERLTQWKGVEPGMIFSVTDCVLYALALGLVKHADVVAHLECAAERQAPAALIDSEEDVTVDANGRHAWLIAEDLVDLAVAGFRRSGRGVVRVRGVREPAQLDVVSAIGEKHGVEACAEPEANGFVRIVVKARASDKPTVLDRIRREGIPVGRELWFGLLKQSSNALAEDTPISRTHTGSFVVTADGSVLGRKDSEYQEADHSMLTAERLEFRR